MSSWPDYDDMSIVKRNSREYRKAIKKRERLFESSQESIRLARKLEAEDQLKAAIAYRKMRAARKCSSDKDIALYHWDKNIQVS